MGDLVIHGNNNTHGEPKCIGGSSKICSLKLSIAANKHKGTNGTTNVCTKESKDQVQQCEASDYNHGNGGAK